MGIWPIKGTESANYSNCVAAQPTAIPPASHLATYSSQSLATVNKSPTPASHENEGSSVDVIDCMHSCQSLEFSEECTNSYFSDLDNADVALAIVQDCGNVLEMNDESQVCSYD